MPVSLVQRGPFSYDEYTNISSSDASTRTFTLDKAKFDPTIGEVLEVFVSGVKLVGDGTFVTGGSNPGTGASAHEFSVNSAKTQLTIVSDSDLATATDSTVTTVGAGNDILIRRVSNRTAKKVDFAPGSVIREADLDNANTQVFHVAQEAIDTALQGMVLDAGSWNAESGGVNRAIKNAATPTSSDPSHYVATKGYVDGTSTTATVSAIANEVTTVAGVSDKVTTVAGAVEETITYTVTVSGGKFYLNGGEFSTATTNPVLNLQRGSTYKFDFSDTTVSSGSHGIGISSTDSNTAYSGATPYTTGQTTANNILTFVIPSSAPSTLYYYCTNSSHNAMGNTINVTEDSIEIVADNIANVNKVGSIDSNVTTVAGIDSNVTTVAGIHGNVTTVAGIHGNVTTVAGIGTNGADVTTVAGKSTEIDVLVNKYDGSTTATSGTKRNITAVNEVATKIDHVDNFNDTYHTPSGTAPSGSNVTEGDLWYDTANDVLKVYDGSSWNAATSSISTVASTTEFTASDGQGTGNKFFAFVVDAGLEIVWLNGVKLKRDHDYHLVNNNTDEGTGVSSGGGATFIRMETVPGTNDVLSVMGFGQISNNLAVNVAGGTFTGGVTFEAGTTHNTGSNTFTMPTTRGTDTQVLTRTGTSGATTWSTSAPAIISVTGGINEDTNTTLTVTGANFESGMTIKLINSSTGADITGHTALSYSGTSSPLTVTIPSATTNITAGTQVKLHITKQGLTTTSTAITVSEDPNWTTTSGTFATINDTLGASQTVGTLSASAGAGGGTIVYASDDSSLDTTYFSLNTSSGVITTTSTALTGLTGSGNYTEAFNANAKIQGSESTKNTLLSGINIIINRVLYEVVGNSAVTNFNNTHDLIVFTTGDGSSSYKYTPLRSNTIDLLIVAAGGGAPTYGGGGGGGQVITHTGITVPTGSDYYITVGTGSANSNGGDSFFKHSDGSTVEYQAIGGGRGSANTTTYTGGSGGGVGSSDGSGTGGSSNKDTSHTSFSGGTINNYGNNGGNNHTSSPYPTGGGGGAGSGQTGGNASSGQAGHGGNGIDVSSTFGTTYGVSGVFAGGGGGMIRTTSGYGNGGSGGGGRGGTSSGGDGVAGTANTGGGAGAQGTSGSNLAGGSGIVIIRVAK